MSNFHVLCETIMSTMLSGNLFIDTKFNADLLKKNDFLDADARGHVNGLVKVFGLKEKDIKIYYWKRREWHT